MPGKGKKDQTKKLFKSRQDKILDGICGGVADYFHIDVTLVRILWIIAAFLNGIGVIAYILAMILVPVNPDHKNLKEEEKNKTNPALIWGVGFILLGMFFLAHKWHFMRPWHFPYDFMNWWHLPWAWWPVGLIILGALYLVHVLTQDKVSSSKSETSQADEHKLKRSQKSKIIGGVCGGLGEHYHVDPVLLRIGFAIIALMTHLAGWGIIYIAMMILIPKSEEE